MRPRTLGILLGISLVLNVFVVGAFVGVFFGRGLDHGAGAGGPRPGGLMAVADGLDPTDREVFRALIRDEVQRWAPTELDARAQRRQVGDMLRAPTFDRAAAGAALDKARNDDMQVRQGVENAMLDFAAKLDQQGRTTLADGLGRGPAWRARRPPPDAPAPSR